MRGVRFDFVSYEVATPVFEGPFDLLLHLILREQVDIHEVSLAGIVDAYLVELDKLQAVLVRRPKRSEVPVTCEVQLVVEYYAAR